METLAMPEEMGMDEILAQTPEAQQGTIVEGVVVSQETDSLLIDVGLKQEASIPLREFKNNIPKTGEAIPVFIVKIRGPEGRPLVSWKQAKEKKYWDQVAEAFKKGETLKGKVTSRIKGGVTVDIGLDAFLPASQIDLRPVHKPEEWVGKELDVKVLEMDRTKGNVLVSRRVILEAEKNAKKDETLKALKVDQVIKGQVTGLAKFGAFVDIGGLEGLLHVSDISWAKNEDPKKALKVGDEIEVKVLKFDQETKKVSLGRKQLLPAPWDNIKDKISLGDAVKGKVTGFAAFGAFVEVLPGVEGLVHVSELSWTDKVKAPKDLLKVGQEVTVKVVGLDTNAQKLSLSLRQAEENPWDVEARKNPPGTKLQVEVVRTAPFGAFVKLPSGLEALIRTQDLSWTDNVKDVSQKIKVGDKVEAVVLTIETRTGKASLGIKQIDEDPMKRLKIGSPVTGTISKITDFGLFVKLPSGLTGLIRPNEISGRSRGQDDSPVKKNPLEDFKEGDEVTASVMKINRKERKVDLSIRRYDRAQEKELLKKYSTETGRPTLGEATGWLD